MAPKLRTRKDESARDRPPVMASCGCRCGAGTLSALDEASLFFSVEPLSRIRHAKEAYFQQGLGRQAAQQENRAEKGNPRPLAAVLRRIDSRSPRLAT